MTITLALPVSRPGARTAAGASLRCSGSGPRPPDGPSPDPESGGRVVLTSPRRCLPPECHFVISFRACSGRQAGRPPEAVPVPVHHPQSLIQHSLALVHPLLADGALVLFNRILPVSSSGSALRTDFVATRTLPEPV